MEDLNITTNHYLKSFFITLFILIIFGLIMVYSSSYIYAKEVFGSSTHYVFKQILFLAISIIMMFSIYKIKFSFWSNYAHVFHLLITFSLILTFVPGVGVNIKGANRWIHFFFFSIQPAEFLKYSTLLVSINFFYKFKDLEVKEISSYIAYLIAPLLILLLQPDFGSFTICLMIIGFVGIFSSFPKKILYSGFFVSGILSIGILFSSEYRIRRVFAYLDPWKNYKTSGFQIIQSYLALANGHIFGQGLGNSNEKLFYLPEAHNDFILSVIGEELGLIGIIFVITLFILLLYFGLKMAMSMTYEKSFMLVASIISIMAMQGFLNMGVVLGLLPTKGLTLPFVSSGGSSLLANFMAIGLILSAIKYEARHKDYQQTNLNIRNKFSYSDI